MARHKDTGSTTAVQSSGSTDTGSHRAEADATIRDRAEVARERRDDSKARDKFGGINWGAGFFGWLVAMGMTILLFGIVGAVLSAVGSQTSITQNEAERAAGTIGIAAGIVLLAVLAIAYFTGGYVAGRMSRFDGGKQGLAVWVVGLVVTLIVIGIGAAFGAQYNIFDRVSLPRLPLGTDQLSWGGIITALAVIVITLLAAMMGGALGHRYHNRVDRAAGISKPSTV